VIVYAWCENNARKNHKKNAGNRLSREGKGRKKEVFIAEEKQRTCNAFFEMRVSIEKKGRDF